MLLFPFFALLHWLELPGLWNKSSRNLVLDFREKAFSFSLLSMKLAVRLFVDAFHQIEICFLLSLFSASSYVKWVLNFFKFFLFINLYYLVIFLFLLINIVDYTNWYFKYWTRFGSLKKLPLIMTCILYIYNWILFANIFVNILHIYSQGILVCSFLSLYYPYLLLVWG